MNSIPYYQIPYFVNMYQWPSEVQNTHFRQNYSPSTILLYSVPFTEQESMMGFQSINFPTVSSDLQNSQNLLLKTKNDSESQNQKLLIKESLNEKLDKQNNVESEYQNSHNESELSNKKNSDKISRKYKQNASRNIMTNIGNQLITFLGSRKKSQKTYLRVNENATEQEMASFYQFIHKLRKRKRSPIYINRDKLLELWYPKNQKVLNSKNYQILRRMSLIFIQEFLPLYMINSTRIKKETKMFHISAIRKFLKLLRYHQFE